MKVENKAPSILPDVESLISAIVQETTILNLSGIIKRTGNKEYCFKISCNNLELIRWLKDLLEKNFSSTFEIHRFIGYYDREART
jgi:hypothetical protein